MTRTPTAYVDDAARALRQARTYLTDELARINAALAALHLDPDTTEVTIEADAEPVAKAFADAADAVRARRKPSTSKTYPCTHPGCDFVGKSPGALGGHRNKHRPKPAPPTPVQPEDHDGHDGHTIDAGPVTVLEDDQADGEAVHVCDECGETFQWRTELARHRRTLGHNTDGDDQ